MRRYLLDSNALNQFVFRRSGVYERAIETRKQGAIIGTCTPVVAEILGGSRYSQTSEVNLPRVEQILKQLKVWAFDIAAAHEYGRIYSELRRTGISNASDRPDDCRDRNYHSELYCHNER